MRETQGSLSGVREDERATPTLRVNVEEDHSELRRGKALGLLARVWDRAPLFAAVWTTASCGIPLALFAIVGVVEHTYFLPGTANGILEDPIFLAYFPMATLLVLCSRQIVESAYVMLASLDRVVKYADETRHLRASHRSTLTQPVFAELRGFHEAVLARLTFHDQSALPIPRTHRRAAWLLLAVHVAAMMGGAVFLALGTRAHWTATETYGFDIWSSRAHPFGFAARFAFEAVLYVVLIPLVLTRLLASIFLMQQALGVLDKHRAIRYLRFAQDEAGGFGEFGEHSLKHVVAVLPFVLPIATYLVFYPVTKMLVLGFVIYCIGLPVIFFVPLLGARRAMNRVKRAELQVIGEAANQHYEQLKKSLGEGDREAIAARAEMVEKAVSAFDSIADQFAWPFNKNLITRFGSIMAALGALAATKFLGV